MKVKKGDTVVVIAGKDRGKSGTIVRTFPKKGAVIVEGINLVTKHKKARQKNEQGQRITKPMPLDVSNVAVKGAKGKPVRIGYMYEESDKKKGASKKIRVSRSDGQKI